MLSSVAPSPSQSISKSKSAWKITYYNCVATPIWAAVLNRWLVIRKVMISNGDTTLHNELNWRDSTMFPTLCNTTPRMKWWHEETIIELRCYLFIRCYRNMLMFNYVCSGRSISNPGMDEGFVNKINYMILYLNENYLKDVNYINCHY
jgi:hypothetical protein